MTFQDEIEISQRYYSGLAASAPALALSGALTYVPERFILDNLCLGWPRQ